MANRNIQHLTLGSDLPKAPEFESGIRRAPSRLYKLSQKDTKLALRNALRYLPQELHETMAPEFMAELKTYGRIYGYRFRPQGKIKAKSIDQYEGQCLAGKAFQLMIDNNLDFDIALYPYELVTYGETGQVCQNWMQYQLIKRYLQELRDDQTLVLYSGHPLGLFPSHPQAPRVMTTNALMVGMFDNPKDWHRAAAIGVANYGQMTAGGWMYIGPQGIVHGTYNTISIAGRLKLGIPQDQNLAGRLFVTSGLGGMSGAQGKAVEIAGAAGIIAEVDESRIQTRLDQGWVQKVTNEPKQAFAWADEAKKDGQGCAIAFHGNIVDLLQYAVEHNQKIDLLSDQTSCHAVYDGGYCPVGLSFDERTRLLAEDKDRFESLVNETLRLHFTAIKQLTERGTYFFDYGNAFMKAVFDAGVKEIARNGESEEDGFIWPSYVEDILGPELFDFGYGPFRWVCLSGKESDLEATDQAAAEVIKGLRSEPRYQDIDNYNWVKDAMKNRLVVGSQARILYQDAWGRRELALKFNDMVRKGEVGPIMLGRDHHDTGGTDSPYRETSNIKDGSNIMADMATQIFAGNAARGMSLVALHNGGGVGIGKSINGGFGLLLDGSTRTDDIIQTAMPWDVMGGVARRAWAGNPNSISTSETYNQQEGGHITLPFIADEHLIDKTVSDALAKP
ncbi:urocanate hydratase [Pseudobacteriovorax antillogorgiicola]|uniref:Urocanate hydratase n=1 Tax=Pseudobacteriovorax antillogorgiicola TaxID=1513793 RepID=A0A1Y6CQU7_9BACT|nr:urocanate hydratase [Pseudobacteriovorax antillogorgiicola]TCS46416.1 urocanate hydratase [Pseudobacteriovorax antillogorgiicola]SMF68956.1 urocanate hydratase [Pseudobacteriovorax antillogorgiicola]